MKLTDRFIVNLKATGKVQKHADGGGLYIQVSPTGGKLWRMFFRYDGKAKQVAFGQYPAVSLKMARERRDEAKELLARGIDPAAHKQEMKKVSATNAANSFEAVAREWHLKQTTRKNPNKESHWTDRHAKQVIARLEKNVFPYIGRYPIGKLKAADVLAVLRRLEDRQVYELAHRIMQICGQVCRYAVATGRAERNVVLDLEGALTPHKVEHHATITIPREIGGLLRAIDEYQGDFITACALKIAPLVFVRPGELRGAEWAEFDLEQAEWRIPKERMKMDSPHIVPLASQTLAILRDLQKVTGSGKYLFPSARTASRPMSDNTVNAALRRLGYSKEDMTGHGFRSMASTRLNEMNIWNSDAIERQLAHTPKNKVRASYNFAEFLPERKIMMQVWADYLDGLRHDRILSTSELLNEDQMSALQESLLKKLRFGA
ncbi:MAG: integrase arm-type DNA-binding domain-containing protein [Planctomycetes bacterium]|nr:integrase arm-type DNA-binding domain-containing protein [Planctomycetota bacterium]